VKHIVTKLLYSTVATLYTIIYFTVAQASEHGTKVINHFPLLSPKKYTINQPTN